MRHSQISSARALLLLITSFCFSAAGGAQQAQPAMHAWYRLFDHSIQVTVDWTGVDQNTYAGGSLAVVAKAANGDIIASGKSSHMPTQRLGMPLATTLPDGNYTVEATLTDRNGKRGSLQLPFQRTTAVWENNGIGAVLNKVLTPWTPMTVTGHSASCWGRTYLFGTLGLPAQIQSYQPEPSHGDATVSLLAAPVEIVVETAQGMLKWVPGTTACKLRNEAYVDVTSTARTQGGALTASLNGTLEFDGFYKFTLKLAPVKALAVKSIRLEVALPDQRSLLFQTVADNMRANNMFLDLQYRHDGELWNSWNDYRKVKDLTDRQEIVAKNAHGGPARKLVGNFYPYIWFGDDDRGMSFMADSDRGWVLDYDKPCIDLIRRGGKTILRLLLMNKAGILNQPIETTLSLQATPVKPRPLGGSWRQQQTYGWSFFDRNLVWNNCFEDIKKDIAAGKNEIWYVNEDARKRNLWWRYFCFNSDRIKVTPNNSSYYGMTLLNCSDYQPEWLAHEEEWTTGDLYSPDYGPRTMHVSSNTDYLLWYYKQWHDQLGMTGIYFDNTFPTLDFTMGSGVAWEDEQGRIHPGYYMFNSREFIKRVRGYFTSVTPGVPVLYTHMTDTPCVGYLGFADFWLEGENGGRGQDMNRKNKQWRVVPSDFVDRWYTPGGLANLRTTLGRQWGIMPKYLYRFGFDASYAILGLFDLGMDAQYGYCGLNGIRYDFGFNNEDCQWIPYWNDRKPTKVLGKMPDIYAAVWTRPGRIRVLVSNLGGNNSTVNLRLNTALLSLPKDAVAVDEATGEALRYQHGTITKLAIDRHDYRVVLLAAPGVFPPVTQTLPVEMLPKQRIEAVCDDFTTFKPTWIVDGAKVLWPTSRNVFMDADWYRIDQGRLRINVGLAAHAIFAKPFGYDNCSVQVKVMASEPARQLSPGLAVYWTKNKYAQIGVNGTVTARSLGGKPIEPGPGANMAMGAITWLKITLTPESIEYFASTDGKSWKLVGTQPRADFTGAPDYLVLGQGWDGPDDLFCNDQKNPARWEDWFLFYDDLVVGRDTAG